MAKLSLGQKANRVLRFLLGLRNRYIVALLKPYGFTAADREEGWTLLRALGKGRMDADPAEPEFDVAALRQLDEWENKWFVITSATLARHAPDVLKWFFKNLSQTEGPAVMVSTGTFVERWALLDKPAKKGGPPSGGAAAKKKLAERGLTAEVIGEAKKLHAALGTADGPLPDLSEAQQDNDAIEDAEKAMWAWYLEWSQVARMALSRRSHLKQLGFLSGSGDSDDLADEDGTSEPEAATNAAAEPAPPAASSKKAPNPA